MPDIPNFYSTSKWSPPWAHKNLNGFPLNVKAVYFIISKCFCLYSGEQSSLWGKKEITHKPKLSILYFSLYSTHHKLIER